MKYLFIFVLLLIFFAVASQNYSPINVNSSEINDTSGNSIPYKTLKNHQAYSVRMYPKLTIATAKFEVDSYSENASDGFRKIAAYIFGGNSSNQRIKMTSPVQVNMIKNPSMSFFMPQGLELSSLPQPENASILLEEQDSRIVAVIGFSGWASDKVLQEKFIELKEYLKSDGIEFEDCYSFLGYNPPYKILNRRNEVTIPLINYK